MAAGLRSKPVSLGKTISHQGKNLRHWIGDHVTGPGTSSIQCGAAIRIRAQCWPRIRDGPPSVSDGRALRWFRLQALLAVVRDHRRATEAVEDYARKVLQHLKPWDIHRMTNVKR
jgi:hypothetical protein